MNDKKMNVLDMSRKVCSRVKEHEVRTTTVVSERKYKTHSGLKLNLDQKLKLTVPKPFSFDTGPKSQKGSPCSHSSNRSPSKQTNGETKGKGVKIEPRATEKLKIPTQTRSCSKTRSVSRERVQKTKIDAVPKKPSANCSRAAKPQTQTSKEEKSQAASTKATKSQAASTKATKSQAASTKATQSQAASTKTTKSQAANASKTQEKVTKNTKSGAQPSETAKPQVHFSDAEKSGGKVKDSGSSSVSISKSEISAEEVTSYVSNVVITEEDALKKKFDNEQPNEETYKLEFLNGTGMHFEFDSPESANGINLQSELASAAKLIEASMSKSASKIPRKFAAHSGIKIHSNFKEEITAEQSEFESSCTDFKMANTKSEVIPRKIYPAHSGLKFPSNFKKETIAEQFDFESRRTNFKMTNTKSEVIPRKKYPAHSGLKFSSNFKKETVAEQLVFERRLTNFKMTNTKSEVNQVQITSMVNN